MVTTEQIKELTGRREGLRRHLAIEDKLIELDEEQARTLAPDFWDRPEEAEKQLRKVADELGTNLPVLSMAWILQHPEISCVIAGASKPSQLENNMKAAGFVIPADAMAEIDKITGFHRFERHVG